jgi:H+/Cl- antiporter ClcA
MSPPSSSEREPGEAGTAGPAPIGGRAYLHLVLLGAAIGIPAAVVAALFLALVHDLEHWLWHDLPDALGHSSPPWYLVVGLPIVGALLVLAARALLPGDGGHSPLEGLATAPTPVSHGPGVALAALGTLSFGAVLGPEAPIVALGSLVGVAAGRLAAVRGRSAAVLSGAGEFSAISALFGGPVVAGMLLVEGGVAMGAALLPLLLPGLVAAAIGYLVFIGFGSWGGLDTQGLVVPNLPLYDGVHVGDLGMAAQTRLIVTPVLLAALLVGSQGLDTVPAAVLATASAWLAMALVDRRNERASVGVPPTSV